MRTHDPASCQRERGREVENNGHRRASAWTNPLWRNSIQACWMLVAEETSLITTRYLLNQGLNIDYRIRSN